MIICAELACTVASSGITSTVPSPAAFETDGENEAALVVSPKAKKTSKTRGAAHRLMRRGRVPELCCQKNTADLKEIRSS